MFVMGVYKWRNSEGDQGPSSSEDPECVFSLLPQRGHCALRFLSAALVMLAPGLSYNGFSFSNCRKGVFSTHCSHLALCMYLCYFEGLFFPSAAEYCVPYKKTELVDCACLMALCHDKQCCDGCPPT